MSQSKSIPKLISRFEIGFDNETKAEIDALKNKLDDVLRGLSAKNDSHGDRLLAAMQAEAANDVPESEFLQLGQWVFEGQDDFWQSAAIDTGTGKAHLHNYPLSLLYLKKGAWVTDGFAPHKVKSIDGVFDITKSATAIQRQSKNDVEYLSGSDLDECVPHIDDVVDQPNWLSESVPQITQADMQLIFIKNLSECLIQRMHSMDRFSHDDCCVGADKLMAWDLVYDMGSDRFGFITASQKENLNACFLKSLSKRGSVGSRTGFHRGSLLGQALRTITEDEISNFFGVLEAYHA